MHKCSLRIIEPYLLVLTHFALIPLDDEATPTPADCVAIMLATAID
jgi:hypothetical protein